MMKRLKKMSHKKLIITSVSAFMALALLISGTIFLTNARGAGEDGIAAEVTIGTNTYTKDNKLQILEIVTHEAFDEMSQLVGDDQGAVSWDDMVAACPKGEANQAQINDYAQKVFYNYYNFMNAITGSGSKGEYVCFKNKITGSIVHEPWSVNLSEAKYDWSNIEIAYCKREGDGWPAVYTEVEGGIRNIFGYMLFGHKHMEDKMNVVIKPADKVTKEDIDSAALVYLNSKNHNGSYTEAYKNYYELKGTPVTIPNSGSVNWTLGTYDLDAEVALHLYFKNTVERKALIMASTDKGTGSDGKYSNISRVCLNINSIDADVFYMDFAYEKVSDRRYKGAKGEVRIETENGVDVINVYLNTDEGLLPFEWSPTMYINDTNIQGTNGRRYGYAPNGNNNSYYPAYNGTSGSNQNYLTPSTFVYNSNNSMVNDLVNFDATQSDYDDDGNYRGTSYGDALMRFDLIDNGLYSPRVIEYILGATSDIVIPEGETLDLKVLEIEPAGISRYDENNEADKEIIMKWFGLNATTYKDKINLSIDHVSMNAFNGMTSDIRSDYDLVILGAYDKGDMKTDLVYTDINDLTQKAYDKLIGYAKIGMPLVIDKPIYYNALSAEEEEEEEKPLIKDAVSFTTSGAATVKIWWRSGGDNRQMTIYKADGNVEAKTTNSDKDDYYIDTLQVSRAGTYYLGGDIGKNYIFKIEVNDNGKAYKLDIGTMSTFGEGEYSDGDEVTAGDSGYFKILMSAKTKIEKKSYTFSASYKGTKRLNFGGAVSGLVSSGGSDDEGSEGSETRVSKFNTLDLTQAVRELGGTTGNIIAIDISGTEQSTSRTLKYRIKPKVDIVPVGAPDYNADNPVLVTKKQLADMVFSGTVIDTNKYRVRIFVDRNCDSLFDEDYDSDGAEMLYFAIKDNKPVYGPNTKEGYIAAEKVAKAKAAAKKAADDAANAQSWESWKIQEAERLAAEAEKAEAEAQNVYENGGRILGAEHTEKDFALNLSLPEALNGYIGWRVEVEDVATGLVTNKNGAFAMKNDAIGKKVKVLQVIRDSGSSHIDLKGDVFTDCFNQTTAVTGLGLDVTVMTKSEFNNVPDKDEYLASFSMLVLGLQDNYGNTILSGAEGSADLSQDSVDSISRYIENGNSVLFTHDSMSYKDKNDTTGKATAGSYDKLNLFTTTFKTKIGMQDGYTLTESLKMKLHSSTLYNSVSANGDTRNTNRVTQLNTGEITEYPYKIENATDGSDTIPIARTHGQYFKLNLEDLKRTDEDGNLVDDEDVVVWYTLSQTGSGVDNPGLSKFFSATGQDAVNNFYVYSVGNITYSSAGHSGITENGEEMKLFVNTFVRAILSGNSVPEVKYENAVQENVNLFSKYYRDVTDRDTTTPLEFEYTITDNDLVAGVGRLKQVYMFYDRNNNDRYDKDIDIILAYVGYENDDVSNKKVIYTSSPMYSRSLVSGVTVKCNLWDVTRSAGVSAAVEQEMVRKMNENNLRIGIVATDGNGAKGFADLKIVQRELYKLQ